MTDEDPRLAVLPDIHGHAKGEHKPFAEERPIPYTARMLFLWFYHACRRGAPRFMMVADHMNYLTFEDPAAVNLVRRALKLAQAGDLYGAAETAGVEVGHAQVVHEGLRRGMRYTIGAEVDNDPRSRPDAQNIVDAMKPDGTVRSVHFIPITHPVHGENWMWPFDNPEFKDLYETVGTEQTWEIYMATLLEAVEKLPGTIVGHFYVPAKFGHWPDDATLESYEDRLIQACAERTMAIEINSRYLYRFYAGDDENLAKFRAAHLRLMRKAKEKGVAIAVGSDAHSPKDQGAAFDQVLALLDEADINEIAFPIGGRIARVALRATEELLRQQNPPEPEPEPVVAAEPAPVPEPADAPVAASARARGAEPGKRAARTTPSPRAPRKAKAGGEAAADAPSELPPASPASPAAPQPTPKTKAAAKPQTESKPEPAPKPEAARKERPAAKPRAAVAKKSAAKVADKKAAPVAKVAAKKPAKKAAPVKKAALSKKTVAAKKSAPAKKKSAPAKKAAARKLPAKKAAPKKTASKKAAPKKAASKRPAPKTHAKKKPVTKARKPAKSSRGPVKKSSKQGRSKR